MEETTVKMFGIADAHGIESLIEHTYENRRKHLFGLSLRAIANPQRHAVVYVVELTAEDVETVQSLIDSRDYTGALSRLKDVQKSVEFPDLYLPDGMEEYAAKSWQLIPNHDLDPYWSE